MSKFQYYSLPSLVQFFLTQGKEGDCWDFKQEWHRNMADLLKDIICFANTVHDEDCYLIFGISDALEVVGMQKTRIKQADIIDAIGNLVFAGDIYPKIEVQTITYQSVELDILTIFNVNRTPVYLKKPYGKMHSGCIYTRVGDKNTPDNGNADVLDIENLWKKRLGLTKPPLEYIYDRLHNKAEWTQSEWGYYNVYRPEYTIEITANADDCNAEFYAYAMPNSSAYYEELIIKYQFTTLDSYQIAVLDSGRLSIPTPTWGFICGDEYGVRHKFSYKYYVYGSNSYQILKFLYDPQNGDHQYAFSHLQEVVIFYHSEEERLAFEAFIEENKKLIINEVENSSAFDYIMTDSPRKTQLYKNRLRVGAVLNVFLKKWRTDNSD